MVAILTDPQLIVRGDELNYPMTYKANNFPVDVAGWTISGKFVWDGGELMATTTIISGAGGYWKHALSEIQTATLPLNKTIKLHVRVVDTLDVTKTLAIIWFKAID